MLLQGLPSNLFGLFQLVKRKRSVFIGSELNLKNCQLLQNTILLDLRNFTEVTGAIHKTSLGIPIKQYL